MIDYEVISTGSKEGNCFRLNDILIDVGLIKKDLLPKVDPTNIKHVLITHVHSDHIKKTGIRELKNKNVYMGQEVFDKHFEWFTDFKNVKIVEDNKPFFLDENTLVTPIAVPHDVPTFAYRIDINKDDEIIKCIYATDLDSTHCLPKDIYDYIFLEANYDEDLILKLYKGKQKARIHANLRHISKQTSMKWYQQNSRKGSVYVKLHKSSQFY